MRCTDYCGTSYFSIPFISLAIRDQSRQQGITTPGTGSSNLHATVYTGRDPRQALKSTQLGQQHRIHIHREAPCWSRYQSTEVLEDHKVGREAQE